LSKFDLVFDPPLMNAAGTLGFAPDPYGVVDLGTLGAFVTNPISLAPRVPAAGMRFCAFPGGFLLHSGYPNPGLKAALRHFSARWEGASLPVVVHLLPQHPGDLSRMVARLEEQTSVAGIEIGLPPGCDIQSAREFALAAVGELPVVLRLPFEGAAGLVDTLVDTGLSAVSLSPPRGALKGPDGNRVSGRLYGPAIYPQALNVLSSLVERGLPVIAAGGVYKAEQAEELLDAGAAAVQLDAVLWRGAQIEMLSNSPD
jgi:dihydroorotate dehydrogenase